MTLSVHDVHVSMIGHRGRIVTLSAGVIDQKSSIPKMSTKSSTKMEHVSTSEYFPKQIYFELFMIAKVY